VGRSREQEKLGRAKVLDWGRGGWEELKVNPLIRNIVGPFHVPEQRAKQSFLNYLLCKSDHLFEFLAFILHLRNAYVIT